MYIKPIAVSLLRLLLWLLPLSALISCNNKYQHNTEKQYTDSALNTNADLLFTAPQKAKTNLTKLQHIVKDSANWYKAEVFIGTCNLFLSDTIAAHKCYNHTLQWCNRNPLQTEVAGLLWNHLGVNYTTKGNTEKSKECYKRAFNYLNTPPKSSSLISTTINLADIYFQQGNTPVAAYYYRYALFLCDSLHETRSRTSVLCGLGQVYTELENYKEAHYYFNTAAKNIAHEPKQTKFFYYFTLGNCYYFEKDYAKSLLSFKKSAILAHKINNYFWYFNSKANMAEIYLMEDSLQQAHTLLAECQNVLKQKKMALSASYAFYFNSLLSDLAIAEGREQDISKYVYAPVNQSLINSQRYLMLHYRRLQRYSERMGNYKEAYYCMKRANEYADTLSSLQARNNVAELGKRYQRDTTLLHQQIVLSNYEMQNTRQEKYIIAAIALIVILILSAWLIIMFNRRNALKRLNKQTERITELRMSVVRNRVSPHYIFNVLGTIIPKLQRYPELVEPTDMLIDVLRGNLLSSSKVAVPLRDEIALVKRFINLYHYSKNPYPIVIWDIAEGLEESLSPIPSMSIQIPVENALKHAFVTLNSECKMHISVTQQDDMITLSVTDNGRGYNPGNTKRTERDTGTGLLLINRTLHILNQYNRQKATFSITNVPLPHHGTHTQLTIPTNYDFSAFS